MTKNQIATLMEETFQAMRDLREAGQAEYAHSEENAFANFERIAERTGISRETCLNIFLQKHLDGIAAHINGHTSQREDVSGRIHDALVYLILLKGMLLENQEAKKDDFQGWKFTAEGSEYIPPQPNLTKVGVLTGD